MPFEKLSELRSEIDELDERLLILLAARFKTTTEIGRVKGINGIAPIDPIREAQQQARIKMRAHELGLNPDFAWTLFKVVIDEVVENHRQFSD